MPADDSLRERRESLAARRRQLAGELNQCLDDDATGLAAWQREMADADRAENAKLPANIRRILALGAEKRNKNQQNQLRAYFAAQHPPAKALQEQLNQLDEQLASLAPPKSLVMVELAEPRTTAIFKRGNFLDSGETVTAGTPRMLPPGNSGSPAGRLGLAEWLVDPANPLTARVQVNRAWSQSFGRGIVATEEDFGTQCEPPTHPELLDWLAVDFVESGWSLKHVHRRIAQSATYQQASKFRSELTAKDPNNLLLARGPRLRLSAEQVRDNAVAVSGLLATKMHGPPVYPPQPDGIWRVTGQVDNTYRTSPGEDAWRRGLYTVQRRSGPYPSATSFDAPDRSACTVKRPRTSTPLQALVLQNDPVYVAAAKGLADCIVSDSSPQRERGNVDAYRLTFAFRTVLTRHPTEAELAELQSILTSARSRYATDDAAVSQVLGKHKPPPDTTPAEWSAWFNVAHVLLNLDEAITKN
jgi:hypothetical protein